MYPNKRRSHIHFIKEFTAKDMEYCGCRVVIFLKEDGKHIFDFDNFIVHKYKNPKEKVHSKSLWKCVNSNVSDVIKKEMENYSEDYKYFLFHKLYESKNLPLNQFYESAFSIEGIEPTEEIEILIKKT